MSSEAKVSIVKCPSYSPSNLEKAFEQVCTNAGFPDVKGKKVLLKPNVLSDSGVSDSITTNPEIVRLAIRHCKANGAAEVWVGDSPGMQGKDFRPQKCGIWDICTEEGASWADFTADPDLVTIEGTGTRLPMASAVGKADVVIGLCKMKNHQLMYTTGAVKNFFGTIPGLHKSQCHMHFPSREKFAELLVGIHETVKPDFSIMDAVVAMEGAGPANGSPRSVGLLLASDNDYALDTAQALIMGYDPKDIPVLAQARKENLVPQKISYTDLYAGDCTIKDFVRIPYRKRTQLFSKLVLPFATRFLERKKRAKEARPVFGSDKCICCLKCVQICPAHALSFSKEDKRIVADYSKCIRCYCCHEMCPADAIKVENS